MHHRPARNGVIYIMCLNAAAIYLFTLSVLWRYARKNDELG